MATAAPERGQLYVHIVSKGTTAHSYKEQLQLWGTTETPKGTIVALEEKAIATAEERTAGVSRGDLYCSSRKDNCSSLERTSKALEGKQLYL
jgi:hypothetical protein